MLEVRLILCSVEINLRCLTDLFLPIKIKKSKVRTSCVFYSRRTSLVLHSVEKGILLFKSFGREEFCC